MKYLINVCFLCAVFFTPAYADDSGRITKPADLPIQAFAQLNNGRQMKMSPDATHISYITPYKGRKHIMVFKLDGSKQTLLPPINDADISWFRWKNDDIILISYRFTQRKGIRAIPITRLMTYNLVTDKLEQLIRGKSKLYEKDENLGNIGDAVIDFLPDEPDHVLLQLDTNYDGFSSIFKVNIRKRTRNVFFRARKNVTHWSADENHMIRWGSGYKDKKRIVVYLNPVKDRWENVHEKDWYKNEGISPIKFFDDPRYAYVSAPDENGINGLAKFDLVEGKIIEHIFSHDIVDYSSLVTSPETGKVVGVSYSKDYPEIHFFDKSYQKLYNSINKAMGGGWSDIISMNLKKKMFLIKYNNSNTAGEYYLLNGKTGSLQHLLDANENLPSSLMSAVKPISYEARDGLTIHGYLTLPKDKKAVNLPTVIFPHGGPASRNTMSFDVWAQLFASRGYAVLQPNFRGSTGYGDYFKAAGKKQWGGEMQDDVTDGSQWLIDQGISDPKNICIVGASYGGYAALMGAVKEPDLYQCAVTINGVSDLPGIIKFDKQFIGGEIWTKNIGLEGEKVRTISPLHQAEKIRIPVLIVHAKDDPVVPFQQGKDMYKKLKRLKKKVTYVEVKNGDHYLDTAETRLATFKALEKFLAKHLK